MKTSELRQFISDFFTPGIFLENESIPEIMEWKDDYMKKLDEVSGSCCQIPMVKAEFSARIKRRLYGRFSK